MIYSSEANNLESNMEMESSQFGIGNMEIVLDILTKLYSNPIQTLTQEYISNARDAMRESGNTKDKIQITMPTSLNPTLKIRDFGVGLSEDRINSVFLLYGNSTKRSSNDQTGGFGIGAKSAWSYVDSFNVTSYYNGMKSTYICHKSNSNGNMDRICHEKTKEKNGVLIEIPVKPSDITHFENAIKRTIYFWKQEEQPILTNGEIEDLEVGYKIGQVEFIQDLPNYIEENSYYSSSSTGLVIDGIYYKLSDNILKKLKSKEKLVDIIKEKNSILIRLDNGTVQIAPNREEIIDNDTTIDHLEKVFNQANLRVINEIDSKFRNCKEIKDHIEVYAELTKTFNVDRKVGDYELSNNAIFSEEIGSSKRWGNSWDRNGKNGLLTLKCFGTMGRSWNQVTTDKIVKFNKSYLDFSTIVDEELFYVDKELSPVAVNNHVRTLLNEGKEVVLIPHNLKQVAKDLGAKNLSEVAITKVDRTSKTKINNEHFVIREFTRWGNTQTTKNVNDMKNLAKFYWTRSGENQYEVAKFLQKQGNEVFILTKKAEKTMGKLENGEYIGDYITNFKDDNRDFKTHVYSNLEFKSELHHLKANDPEFKVMAKYAQFKDVGYLPECLVSKETDKKIKEFDILNKKWLGYVTKNYPLLGKIRAGDNKKDLIEYVNLKFEKGVK